MTPLALRPPVRLARAPRRAPAAPFAFLQKRLTPRSVFMAVGDADCSLALTAAGYVERVYAIDVSGQLAKDVLLPCNVRLVVGDGVRIPVPEATVDVAWGGAFVDRLPAEDAREHLRNVLRSLVAGGQYICLTRNPAQLIQAGFTTVRYYAGSLPLPQVAVGLVPEKLRRISAIK